MIVALYKVWRGHEFAAASIESIYGDVGAIVVVSSEIGWNGEKGNTVTPVISAWKKKNDAAGKIKIVDFNSAGQVEQYAAGIKYIRKHYPACTWIMLVDADEVWGESDLHRAKQKYLRWGSKVACFKCVCHGYIKSPYYRIVESGGCQPTIFINPFVDFVGVRGNRITPSVIMYDVYMHHMTAVRDNPDLVLEKFRTSSIGDGDEPTVDLDNWKKTVWDKLPHAENFHYNIGWEHVWKSVEVISNKDLPRCLRKHPLALQN